MDQTLPVTIRRSFIGYVYRFLSGLLAIAGLIGALYVATVAGGPLPQSTLSVVILYLIGVAGITLLSVYLYSLSYMRLTESGVTVQVWTSLFSDTRGEIAWDKVVSATSKQGGVIGELFGFGTVTVFQSSAAQPITLTFVQDADHWVEIINQQAQSHPARVHNV